MNALQLLAVIHGRLAIALLLFAVLLGLWGSFSLARRRGVSGGFRSSYLLMFGLTALQGLLGIVAYLLGGQPREGVLHVVYGVFALFALIGVYFWSARGHRDREAMLMAVTCWVVAIAYGRGLTTGQ
jgi:heme A synthase